jgi:hypothetical protein
MNYLKLHAVSIFALGVGLFMLQVPDLNIWLHLGIGILTVIGAVLTIVQYAPVMGWKLFMTRPDLFGPEGESHERFDLGTALVADVILMSGLLAQGWHVLFGMQFVACIIGYAVIQSFLTNYHAIYAFVNGSETV